MIKETAIHNISELIVAVEELVNESDLVWWFRGHKQYQWDLIPEIKRSEFDSVSGVSMRRYDDEIERKLVHEFYIKAKNLRHPMPHAEDYAGWLTLMQHYGLPTRLLDWSRSPLISVFYAAGKDGVSDAVDSCIWVLCPSLLNERFNYRSYLYPMDKYTVRALLASAFSGSFLTTNSIIACWAVEYDLRVYVQQSAFTVHDLDTPLNRIEGCENWLRKFIIPSSAKPRFRRELDLLGFRLSDVFPDLEHLAEELRSRL